jgi:predicted acetyltransferase
MVPDAEIVHGIPVEEADAWSEVMLITFLEPTSGPEFEADRAGRAHTWVPERHWGARADGRWVATLSTLERTLTVPGTTDPLSTVPADALTQVTVLGTHRRQGLLTAMLSDSLQTARERGDAVAVLMAAEASIYGRFGYAPAEQTVTYRLHSRRPGAVPPRLVDGGRLRQVSGEEFGAIAPGVFARAAALRAGNIDRPPKWWDRVVGLNGLIAPGPRPTYIVHEGQAGPDGYVVWRPGRENQSTGQHPAIVVDDLATTSGPAYQALWHYLATMDLVGEILLYRRPVDEEVHWLLPDLRNLEHVNTRDGLWLRVLDVPAALSARRYATSNQIVIEVVDDAPGGYAHGTFALDGGPEHASCRPASGESADVTLSQRALGSIYLGGFGLREQLLAGEIDEHTAGGIRRLDAMFATDLAPWCSTDF